LHTLIKCLVLVGRQHGVDLTVERLVHDYALEEEPDSTRLIRIAQDKGLKARSKRMKWADLRRLGQAYPVIARLGNGNGVILTGFHDDDAGGHVEVLDPLADRPELLRIDGKRMIAAWTGEIIMLKRSQGIGDEDQPFGLRWFIPEVLRQKGVFIQITIAALMLHVLALTTPIFFQLTFDKVLGNQSIDTLYVLTTGVIAALLFNALLEYLRGLMLVHATSKIDVRVATRTFHKLLSLPITFFQTTSTGVLSKHMQQSSAIREFLTGRLFLTILDLLVLVVYLPVLYFYNSALTNMVLGFAATIAAISLVIISPYHKRLQALYIAEGDRQALLVESIGGMETIKAMAMEPTKRQAWDQCTAKAVAMHMGVSKISLVSRSLSGLLQKIMMIAIIFFGAHLVFSGELTLGAIIAFNMLSVRVTAPLVAAVGLISEFQQAALSVRMLGKVMNQPPERASTVGLTPQIAGQIDFEDVSFRYSPEGPLILDDVSFQIKAGQVIGVVGRSGSGKSTITRLIQGLYRPDAGIIRLDGIDIREVDLSHIRLNIGAVLQESFMFNGSVRQNIAATRPDAAFQEIVSAAQLAGADEFIERLPQGYDTVLEEGASNISGGQKQRLAIARALLRNPPILIFDEATSALDPESEAIIQANMRDIAAGRTVFNVSHRLSSLVNSNAIMVIDRGIIVDLAPHAVLLERCDIYRHLWERQTAHMSSAGLAAE